MAIPVALYVYVATAGRYPQWPRSETRFYNLQADAFLSGQAHLHLTPPAELVAQPNPYDRANLRLWLWDSTYYRGKYFIYWGPVPALLVALVKWAVEPSLELPDNRVVLWFAIGRLLCGVVLLCCIGRTVFRDLKARWPIVLAIAVFAFAAPQLFLLARPAVYEGAIMSAQFFLLAGAAAAFWGLAPARSDRARALLGATAGVLWAMAIGCRIAVLPAVAALVPITAMAYGRSADGRWLRLTLKHLGLIAAPVLAGAFLLGLFNKVRFDSWTQFGDDYQLAFLRASLAARFVPFNLYSYFFRPPRLSCEFPFVLSWWLPGAQAFPKGVEIPSGYVIDEPVLGLVWVAPWFLLGAIALVPLRSIIRRRSVVPSEIPFVWLVSCAVILATAPGLAALGMPLATMRYVGDVGSGLALLSILGFLVLLRCLQDRNRWVRRAVLVVCVLIAGYTVCVGILLGADGYYAQLRINNPDVYKSLQRSLSWPDCPWVSPKG